MPPTVHSWHLSLPSWLIHLDNGLSDELYKALSGRVEDAFRVTGEVSMASAMQESSKRAKTYYLAVDVGEYEMSPALPSSDVESMVAWATTELGGHEATEKLLRVNRFCLASSAAVSTTRQRRFVAALWINVWRSLGMYWHLAAVKQSYSNFMDCDDDELCCTTMEGTDYGACIAMRKGNAFMEVMWLQFVDKMMVISRKALGVKLYEFSGDCHQHAERRPPTNLNSPDFRTGRMWQKGRLKEQLFQCFQPKALTPQSRASFYDDCELFSLSSDDMEKNGFPAFGAITSHVDYGALCAAGKCEFHAGVDERRQLMCRAQYGEEAELLSNDNDPKMAKWLAYKNTLSDWCTSRKKMYSAR